MNMRGKHAVLPENTIKINVTSCQSKSSIYRRDFSPMTPIEGGYKGFYCFENYWQGYKRFSDGNHIEDEDARNNYVEYWKNLECAKRKGKFKRVFDAMYEDGIPRDYIDARKNIYIPQYYDLMIGSEAFMNLKNSIEKGYHNSIAIYDLDGPRKEDGSVDCVEVTLDFLREKVNSPTFPFGHGYIVAAALCGFHPSDYCN